MKLRVCRTCGLELSLLCFDKCKQSCKDCRIKIKLEIKQNNRNKCFLSGLTIKERNRKYYLINKEKIDAKAIDRYYKNPKENNKKRNERYKKAKIKKPYLKVIQSIRSRHSAIIKNPNISSTQGLGCTREFFIKYLESKFENGMDWNNYGLNKDNWTIDHIIPLSLAKVDENKQWLICQFNMMLMHYSNLQPMWLIDNIKKSNKIQ